MKDKYDLAIEYLTENPAEIKHAWGTPANHPAGCLFQFATSTGGYMRDDVGCLTTISLGVFEGWTPEITERIRNNQFIPKSADDIKVEHLVYFAEEQRLLDKEIRNQ